MRDPLRHHGDVEVRDGLLDFAVNVYDGPRPAWLDAALRGGLDAAGSYPSATAAEGAVAARHGRDPDEVLATAGAAEAFSLIARLRRWERPVVVHPQFTEPHAALLQAGHDVTEVVLGDDFTLDPGVIPDDADLVVVGNPTNPTGVLHPRPTLTDLLRPGRLVLVDEAFMDAVPGEPETLAADRHPGLVVTRSLTKHWGIPGVRAGYLLGDPAVVAALRREQVPWSVSSTAAAAMLACCTEEAVSESRRRAEEIAEWRRHLEESLSTMGIRHIASHASFVLADVGDGVHDALRVAGIAVRRADTFPGLGPSWVRIAVRPPARTRSLLDALSEARSDALG
ncbi:MULTISPECIES: Rv2231c family pyridoxal phosphate-dependent protein CobC [unclassified Nocardioides]|uniref:Rv2231c family pyridoxal phosphate-dependent protein CobC n=1 Tax=unclassified Nocardioides TaxID=2615069 RepID=UPI000AB97638|nr:MULTISPECIES: Rv2231c family pyridoxal phosphate-dependent protein CobC [unclassified Nocardioides]